MIDPDWSKAYGIGIPDLDGDLRRLHDLYCAVRASLEGEAVRADVHAVCAELIDTVRTHFAREEALMEACDYPDRAAHRKMHHTFLEQVEDVWTFVRAGRRTDQGAGGGGDGCEGGCEDGDGDDYVARFLVLGFMGKWLKMHMMVVDQRFGEFLALRGLLAGPVGGRA